MSTSAVPKPSGYAPPDPRKELERLNSELVAKDAQIAVLQKENHFLHKTLSYYQEKYGESFDIEQQQLPSSDKTPKKKKGTPESKPPSRALPSTPALKPRMNGHESSELRTSTPSRRRGRDIPSVLINLVPHASAVTSLQNLFRRRIDTLKAKAMIDRENHLLKLALLEIHTAEIKYCRTLENILTIFKKPLKTKQPALLSPEEIRSIFCNLGKIFKANSAYLAELGSCYDSDLDMTAEALSTVILKHIPEWRCYATFCNNYSRSMEAIDTYKSRKAFSSWLRKAESDPVLEKLALTDLLIAPVKRIPQYELLLTQAIKYTSPYAPSYAKLNKAKLMINELANWINLQKKTIDNISQLKDIQMSLHGNVPTIVAPHRELIRQTLAAEKAGRLFIDKKFYLFTDSLLITYPSNIYDKWVFLKGAAILSVEKSRQVVVKTMDDTTVILSFSSDSETQVWNDQLTKQVDFCKTAQSTSSINLNPKTNIGIERAGFLLKLGRNGKWHKRWFHLEGDNIYYLKSPNQTEAKGINKLSLKPVSIQEDFALTNLYKMRFAFSMTKEGQAFILAANAAEDRRAWIQALRVHTLNYQRKPHQSLTGDDKKAEVPAKRGPTTYSTGPTTMQRNKRTVSTSPQMQEMRKPELKDIRGPPKRSGSQPQSPQSNSPQPQSPKHNKTKDHIKALSGGRTSSSNAVLIDFSNETNLTLPTAPELTEWDRIMNSLPDMASIPGSRKSVNPFLPEERETQSDKMPSKDGLVTSYTVPVLPTMNQPLPGGSSEEEEEEEEEEDSFESDEPESDEDSGDEDWSKSGSWPAPTQSQSEGEYKFSPSNIFANPPKGS